jgi:hypothetical protein
VAFDFTRTYGIEIECIQTSGNRHTLAQALNRAGLRHQAVVQSYGEHDTTKWGLTTDNSISGGRMGEGVEIRGPILLGQEGLNEIEKVCQVLEQMEFTIHPSCGLHVHIDVRRPTPVPFHALRRLALFYAQTESLLDLAMARSRRGVRGGNGYACSVANLNVERLAHAQDASAIGRVFLEASRASAAKFHKINFEPVVHKGTVEFRHHGGTIEFAKIKNWIALCQRYIRMAENEADYPISAAQVQHVQRTAAVRPGTKTYRVYELLTRPEGATEAELLAATGWSAITVPGMARKMGITLRTEQVREGATLSHYSGRRRRILRYFGMAVTPQMVAAAANIPQKPESWEQLADRLGMTDEEKRFWAERVQQLAAPIAANIARPAPPPFARPGIDPLPGIPATNPNEPTPF